MRPARLMSGLAVLALVAGCGSSSSSSGGAGSKSGHGPVSVLYAGSLVSVMEDALGPAFTRAQGYSFQGFAAGSTELVAQIKSGVRQGDVFVSASPEADKKLEGSANGSWVTWYITFGKAPLVIGYSPQSKFASQFASRPWYDVITQPGIRVGRTDPKLDPKGKLTVEALDEASTKLRQPALLRALPGFPVFPEEALVGRLQSGQLDAGFFYTSEAAAKHIPTAPLTGISKSATYTVSILKSAPDAAGAEAFVQFLLGPQGRTILAAHGITVLSARVSGSVSAVPAPLRRLTAGG